MKPKIDPSEFVPDGVLNYNLMLKTDVTDSDYSDDFEADGLSSVESFKVPQCAQVDQILSQLASTCFLPSQICEIRRRIVDLFRISHLPGTVSTKYVTEKSFHLSQLLEQFEIDLLSRQRKQNLAAQSRTAARRAVRARAHKRRTEQARRFADVKQWARAAEQAEAAAKHTLRDADLLLRNSDVLLKLNGEDRSRLEKKCALRDQELAKLRLRLVDMSIVSQVIRRQLLLKVLALEASHKLLKIQRDLELGLLRTADMSTKRWVAKDEDLKQKHLELDEKRLGLARYRARLETDYSAQLKRSEAAFSCSLDHYKQEFLEEQATAQATLRAVGDELIRGEQQRLARLKSALDAEKATIVRDRSKFNMLKSRYLEDHTALRAEREALLQLLVKKGSGSALHRVREIVLQQESILAHQTASWNGHYRSGN